MRTGPTRGVAAPADASSGRRRADCRTPWGASRGSARPHGRTDVEIKNGDRPSTPRNRARPRRFRSILEGLDPPRISLLLRRPRRPTRPARRRPTRRTFRPNGRYHPRVPSPRAALASGRSEATRSFAALRWRTTDEGSRRRPTPPKVPWRSERAGILASMNSGTPSRGAGPRPRAAWSSAPPGPPLASPCGPVAGRLMLRRAIPTASRPGLHRGGWAPGSDSGRGRAAGRGAAGGATAKPVLRPIGKIRGVRRGQAVTAMPLGFAALRRR